MTISVGAARHSRVFYRVTTSVADWGATDYRTYLDTGTELTHIRTLPSFGESVGHSDLPVYGLPYNVPSPTPTTLRPMEWEVNYVDQSGWFALVRANTLVALSITLSDLPSGGGFATARTAGPTYYTTGLVGGLEIIPSLSGAVTATFTLQPYTPWVPD